MQPILSQSAAGDQFDESVFQPMQSGGTQSPPHIPILLDVVADTKSHHFAVFTHFASLLIVVMDESQFWEKFKWFADRKGIQTKKPPKAKGVEINLFRLYEAVCIKRKGFRKVDADVVGPGMRSVWRADVADEVTGLKLKAGSTTSAIKNQYKSFLLSFEQFEQKHRAGTKKSTAVLAEIPVDHAVQLEEEKLDTKRLLKFETDLVPDITDSKSLTQSPSSDDYIETDDDDDLPSHSSMFEAAKVESDNCEAVESGVTPEGVHFSIRFFD